MIGFSAWFIERYFVIEAHVIAVLLWPPATAWQRESRELRKVAGWFSIDCGHVKHREDADTAIACANQAIQSRHPFYVAFDWVGIDARGTLGIAGNSGGVLYEVDCEEFGRGWAGAVGPGTHIEPLRVTRCQEQPTVRMSYPANRYLSCSP
jgi:hypothetical protein